LILLNVIDCCRLTEYLKHIRCGVPKENFEPLHVCVDNYVAQINWLISKDLPKEDQLGGMCCSVFQLHKCFVGRTGEACDKVTGPETKEYFDKSMTASVRLLVQFRPVPLFSRSI
jgi:hypothetical protein